MKPRPWSHTSLEDFINCPRAFHERRIVKSVQEEESEQLIWGSWVHKQFEEWQKEPMWDSIVKPLEEQLSFMRELYIYPGEHFTERKVALDHSLRPCGFFSEGVWWRGVLDWSAIDGAAARIVDYKTGKPHEKFKQLKGFALWVFAAYPDVDEVLAQFYWTKTRSITEQVYKRGDINTMWGEFAPDLRQYVEAFKTDTWQPRKSGLCRGYCPVTSCENWEPRRR
jgi:hypothetical protein